MDLIQGSMGAKESRSCGRQLCPGACPSGKRNDIGCMGCGAVLHEPISFPRCTVTKLSLFGYLFPFTDEKKNANIAGDTAILKFARLMGHPVLPFIRIPTLLK